MSGLFRALHRTKVFRNLTEQEFAWVLYDVGNSAFIMLACSLIPIWFKSLAIGTGPGKISSDQATAYYSLAISIVTVVVALIGPDVYKRQGADRAVNYQCDSEGTALNYEVFSEAISSVRCSAPLNADWKKRIDEDYKKRGGK